VAIVATARKISEEEIRASVNILKSWGLEVVIGNTIGKSYNQYAGTDDERRKDLQQVLDNPEIRAVFCARGGYGTLRIIDDIDFTAFQKNPKWVVGFSDITVLHAHIQEICGIESIHSLMPINFQGLPPHDPSISSLKTALFGEALQYVKEVESPGLLTKNRAGEASGILIGGNLSLIYALQGGNSDPDTSGKILFIEDLDEYLYHVDRMVLSLKRSGKLSGLAGLLVGGMTDMKDNLVPYGKSATEIIMEHVEEFSFPVAFGFPAGHTKDNRALILGRKVFLKVYENRVLLDFEK
jgi:muramoyltetrapeptide carboxypeptidase